MRPNSAVTGVLSLWQDDRRSADAVLLETSIERPAREPQGSRRLGPIVPVELERANDQLALRLGQRRDGARAPGQHGGRRRRRRLLAAGPAQRGEVGEPDLVARSERVRALDEILEL